MAIARDTRPELLSPAGNWDCAKAAVASGADAIFFGLSTFNARMRADNFTLRDLPELMDYLHRHGRRGYVTMNTLIFTNELPAAIEQLKALDAAGVDAAIVQDLGLAHLLHLHAPNVDLHASTQMTITSPEGLSFIDAIVPLDTAVLSRELSIKEIARFQKGGKSHIPIEVFCHGALCVAYSGQCLTSESLGQRSANRGECAQACRMPYDLVVDGKDVPMGDKRYLLSPQDLAAVDVIPEMIEAGIASFKIEGRLKSPEYVAAVTRVYRKAIDAALEQSNTDPVTDDDRYALEMTFSRGLSTGWLRGTDHPYLTHGRFGKKRGPEIGIISDIGDQWIEIDPKYSDSSYVPKAGDGIVIDEGLDRNAERGAKLHRVDGNRLVIDRRSSLNLRSLKVGQVVHKTSDPALNTEIRKTWKAQRVSSADTPLDMHVTGALGRPLTLRCTTLEGITTEVSSEAKLEPAAKRALDADSLIRQLGRLGDSAYSLGAFTVDLPEGCYLPVSAINQLRRAALAGIENTPPPSRAPRVVPLGEFAAASAPESPRLSVLCRSMDQVAAAIKSSATIIYCDFEDPRRYKDAVAVVRAAVSGQRIFLATPRIQKPTETGYFRLIEKAAPDGVLIRNAGAIIHFAKSSLAKVGDFSLNVSNPVTAQLLMDNGGFEYLTVSYDLNIGQVLELVKACPSSVLELTLHQHMPMFHMEHCVFCTFLSEGTSYKDCGRPCEKHVVHLRDRVGQLHRLHADVGCRNTLFNGRAQTGARFFPELVEAGLRNFRLELLDESGSEATAILNSYADLLSGESSVQQTLRTVPALQKLGVTEGTLAKVDS